MKKTLILLLLIIKPISAGSLLSKYFKSKSKPKVELTDLAQGSAINNQEQKVQERNRLLGKYLLLGDGDINFYYIERLKILEPLKIKKLEISAKEASERLKVLFKETYNETWHRFRQEAATLINSGANPNINHDPYFGVEDSLINHGVRYQDYFFTYFLLKRRAKINQYTLTKAKTLKMAELLISYEANPRETKWYDGNPLIDIIVHNRESKLLFFYVDIYKYPVNEKYQEERGNLLHMLFRVHKFDKEKVIILLSLGVNPYEKNDNSETPIEKAKRYLNSSSTSDVKMAQEFLDGVEEYDQMFRETLIDQTKDSLLLELQDYIYKFHAGENAELFAPKENY